MSSSGADYSIETCEKELLSVVKTLEKRSEVTDISVLHNPPVSKSDISAWEQSNLSVIPDDLRNFYLVKNGFTLRWNVKINDTSIPVGEMKINSLELLKKLTLNVSSDQDFGNLSDIIGECNDRKDIDEVPTFGEENRIFELDDCRGFGKVCIVYHNTKPGLPAVNCSVWFMDRGLRCHFLATSFLNYYRMLLVHVGLPQWQYAFTDLGLSLSAKQWFNFLCPLRLDLDAKEMKSKCLTLFDTDQSHSKSLVQLDISKVFKGKSEKKKPTAQTIAHPQVKKKLPFSTIKPNSGKSVTTYTQPSKLNIQ